MLDGFIVLGLVPGTHLQITFSTWIVILCSLTSFILIWRSYRREVLQRIIITSSIFAMTHRALPERMLNLRAIPA
jgi:hypothetical protein